MAKIGKTKFEVAVIDKVKEIRISKGLSQYDISLILGTSSSFIGQVEIQSHPSKYNLNHLNKLAFEFGCAPKDFLPVKPIRETDWDKE
jgi:transcriptional regulator with XRE-family HTH domain